jgi:hypothetical protein
MSSQRYPPEFKDEAVRQVLVRRGKQVRINGYPISQREFFDSLDRA